MTAGTINSFVAAQQAYYDRKSHIDQYVWAQCNGIVHGGPFQGMALATPTVWTAKDWLGPMILGCYEQELHPHWRDMAARRRYAAVINVGSSEGYYAIGLARLFPQAVVHAFEMLAESHAVLRENARLNGVEQRIVQHGPGSPEAMRALLAEDPASLAVIDCEGYETVLISPDTLADYRHADLVIETHDFVRPGITQELAARLAASHEVAVVPEGARDPNVYPFLEGAVSLDRWIAVCENRPMRMSWIVARSRAV